MSDIVITEFMDGGSVERLGKRYDVVYDPNLFGDRERLLAILAQSRAVVVRNQTSVDGLLLSSAPNLECVGRLGVGLDNIDLDGCRKRGVTVYPATGANDQSVAEYVVASTLVLMRKAYLSSDRMLDGAWPRQSCTGSEIAGKSIGLIGFGSTARRTADLAKGLGLRVFAHDPFLPPDHPAWSAAENLELGDLLERSDVVSLHLPLTPETRNFMNSARIESMKPGALLINPARGGIVDESALVSALRAGRLGGAALDVFETEPLTARAARQFSGVCNLLLTPHVAGVTEESNARVSALIAEKVADHLSRAKA